MFNVEGICFPRLGLVFRYQTARLPRGLGNDSRNCRCPAYDHVPVTNTDELGGWEALYVMGCDGGMQLANGMPFESGVAASIPPC